MVRNDSQRHQLGNLQYAAVAAAGWRTYQLSNYLLAVSVSERSFAYIFVKRGRGHFFNALCTSSQQETHTYGQDAGIPDLIVSEQPL